MASMAVEYAQALLKASSELDHTQRVADGLKQAEEVIVAGGDYFFNPESPAVGQISLVEELFRGELDELVVQFLIMLIRKRRLRALPAIRKNFSVIAERSLGTVKVLLRIPFEPDQALLEKLRNDLAEKGLYSEKQKSQASFEITLDKSLIGGFIAEYDGSILDASLKTRLFNLRPAAGLWG